MLNRKDCAHPGWGSVTSMYYGLQEIHMKYGISSVYVSKSNKVTEDTPFISSADCPTLKNKWECAFLPTTNCTLPSFIQNCDTENCIETFEDTSYFSAIFTNFSESATLLSSHNDTELQEKIAPAKKPRNFLQANYSKRYGHVPGFTYLRPHSLSTGGKDEVKLFLNPVSTQSTISDHFYLRYSSLYRFKLQEYFKEFHERYPFFKREMNYLQPKATEFHCIAAHVRRGDRMIYGENMTEYCKTHQSNEDAGCGTKTPFGNVAFDPLVRKAELLINKLENEQPEKGKKKYNLVVASDDPFWLEEQKELYDRSHPDSDWNILTIFPSKQFNFTRKTTFSDNDEYQKAIWDLRARGGTKSGIFFHATLKLFQQCDGYVGHLGSGVAFMLYSSMCYRNNLGMAVCPPAFDLRSSLS
jgi:hypothetical protein